MALKKSSIISSMINSHNTNKHSSNRVQGILVKESSSWEYFLMGISQWVYDIWIMAFIRYFPHHTCTQLLILKNRGPRLSDRFKAIFMNYLPSRISLNNPQSTNQTQVAVCRSKSRLEYSCWNALTHGPCLLLRCNIKIHWFKEQINHNTNITYSHSMILIEDNTYNCKHTDGPSFSSG